MNWNPAEASWKQLTADVKRKWDKLIDGQLDLWSGKSDHPKRIRQRHAREQEIQPPK